MRDEFQIWVDAVCEQVRFWPDRKGIEKELHIHYEDHCQALERLNYEPELAAERSLRAMGNPREVGRALDRVHKPWLGWLWEASRVMVWAVGILLAVSINSWWESRGPSDITAFTSTQEQILAEMTPLECPPAVQAGEYRVAASRAGCRRIQRTGEWELLVELAAETPKLWLPGYALRDMVEAVDSNGVCYTDMIGLGRFLSVSSEMTHGRHWGWLVLSETEGRPEWVEFTHKTAGWTIRIDLPRGEEGVM